LHRLLRKGLAATAPLWPPIQTTYDWVHQAAHLLANHQGQDAASLQQAYQDLLTTMSMQRAALGSLTPAVAHFQKVTASYWPGLFCCYDVPGLPRTNNDLEQYFGAARHLERRATGRKGASPALVVRGSVRVVAAVASRLQPFTAADLRVHDVACWRALRQPLAYRHAARRTQLRFRRDPAAYLARLEACLLKPGLPP
jgi:hypothetical protein